MLWYFVEGVKFRLMKKLMLRILIYKYQVPVDDETLVFYESQLSGRWWIEIPSILIS